MTRHNTSTAHTVTISEGGAVKIEFGQAANDEKYNAIGRMEGGPNFELLNKQLNFLQKESAIAPDTTLAVAQAHRDTALEHSIPAASDAIIGQHTAGLAAQQSGNDAGVNR